MHTVALAGVTVEKFTKLTDNGILNDIELGTLSQANFDVILPTANIVTRQQYCHTSSLVHNKAICDLR